MGRIAIANRAADVRKTLEDSRKKRGAICVGVKLQWALQFISGPPYSCANPYTITASHSSTKSASPVEYGYVQGVEHLSDYRPGGYHPIYINDRLDKRYRIVHKLGHGTFSTAWLAIDEKASRYVAIKVGTADAKHAEFDILSQLTQSVTSCSDTEDELSQIPIVLDRFDLSGPNVEYLPGLRLQ
ncbi:RNA exonuclease 3 [Verticillium dahliae VDG2]|nr:RNA exonuclease 3 [Verticillium dahliae VDG2]